MPNERPDSPNGQRRRHSLPLLAVALLAFAGGVLGLRAVLPLDRRSEPSALTASTPAKVMPATTAPSDLARPTPSPTKATAPKGRLVIHGAGDVSLDPGYISTYGSHGYGYAWSGLNGLFLRDHLTVVNVECPVSDEGSQLAKQFSFHGDPAALPAMRAAGVEVGNLANNHAYDRGPEALVDSRKNLLEAGIQPVGAGKDADEAAEAAIFHLNGWTVAVVGIDEVIDPDYEVATADKPGTAAGHDFDAGSDVIFGGHSHRLQPLAYYRGSPIFYSLGNFVWPNFSAAGSATAVAEVTVTPSGKMRGRLIPVVIEAPGHPVLLGS